MSKAPLRHETWPALHFLKALKDELQLIEGFTTVGISVKNAISVDTVQIAQTGVNLLRLINSSNKK